MSIYKHKEYTLGIKVKIRQGLWTCWWAHLDLNQGPIRYERTALTPELWARILEAAVL